ncbi:MAG: hypothetical protein DRJ63_04005 [Thermoprotei archaeon]|nr:MAG: hypothetical protein DRJ63_04005 [Thermoprotei archaeon]
MRKTLLFKVLSYEEYSKAVAELGKMGAQVEEIGFSLENRAIHCIKLGDGDIRILAICRLHGNEPATTNATLYFTYLYLDEGRIGGVPLKLALEKCTVAMIPAANPDGLAEYFKLYSKNPKPSWENPFTQARVNARGVDLNRDWLYLTQKETRCLHKFLNRFKPHIVLDMHEFYFKGGYPPQWPDSQDEFMISLTDTPYFMVSPTIKKLSLNLMQRVAEAFKEEGYSHWKTRLRWFVGEEKGADREVVIPAIFLGSHVPYEHSAKLLVETWGVGLGDYLLSDRVTIHALAIAHTALYAYEQSEAIKEAVSQSISEDLNHPSELFRVKGHPKAVADVRDLLELHDIKCSYLKDEVLVKLPQERSRMALILLDQNYELNRKLIEKRKFYTLNYVYNVHITKYS